jgi:hypothetical protein
LAQAAKIAGLAHREDLNEGAAGKWPLPPSIDDDAPADTIRYR